MMSYHYFLLHHLLERRFTDDLDTHKARSAAEKLDGEYDEVSDHSLLPDSDDESYIDSEEERARIFAASKVRKASKMLGVDEEEVQDVQVTTQVEREWYLNYDYQPKDITINMEGDVTGATVDALIERLTIHDADPDPNLTKAFFLCFRCFVNPVDFVDKLQARFDIAPPQDLNDESQVEVWRERKLWPIRQHIFNSLKTWLEQYWIPDEDDDALEDIHAFLDHEAMQEMDGIDDLADLVERRVRLYLSDV